MQADSTLSQLKAHFGEQQLPSSYGVYFKNTLVALCHALEDHILQQESKPLVLVTFQQGKWYLQEAERYALIAEKASRVVIAATPDGGFAAHKTGQLPNVSLIELVTEGPLTEEWNLIILAPNYAATVLCHELSPDEYRADTQPNIDTERKFYGLWTFDRAVVEKSASILIEHFAKFNAPLAQELAQQKKEIGNSISSSPADLSSVVNRIVSYLQTSQQELITVNRQKQELVKLEGQALKLNRNLTSNKLQAFLRMAQRVDQRDAANPIASLQVAALCETLGQLIDLPTLKLRRLRLAGLLFRVGLAEAPPEVFTEIASQLDEVSSTFWRNRAVLSSQLLHAMPELRKIAQVILYQLEHWDGSGKPEGLKEEDIPIESRILGLCIYFQELTQTRGSRQALTLDEALEKCNQRSGTRFDANVVEHLATVIRLTEMGLMSLPKCPSHVPTIWLEDSNYLILEKSL